MKALHLTKGQKIQVVVEELQSQQQMLVSFQGHLFRVQNTSKQIFQRGETITLWVVCSEPIELSLSPERQFVRVV